MKNSIALLFFTVLFLASCMTPKDNASNNSTMEFTITHIKNEKDGQTVSMKDDNGGKFITVISIPNGNFLELNVGDRISLTAEEIMESDPAQVISKNIKVLNSRTVSPVQVAISTDKQAYKSGEPVLLSFTVTNNGKKPFTFLPWKTPIEEQMTGGYMDITHDGKPVQYHGIMVKRMPPTEKDYLTIEPGKSVSAEVDLLKGYDLKKAGKYTLQFEEVHDGLPKSNEVKVVVE